MFTLDQIKERDYSPESTVIKVCPNETRGLIRLISGCRLHEQFFYVWGSMSGNTSFGFLSKFTRFSARRVFRVYGPDLNAKKSN